MIDSAKRFSIDLRTNPLRILSTSFVVILVFHAVRFWIRQIGTFNSLNIPISTFAPAVGKELVVGPVIEVVRDLQNLGPLKWALFGGLIVLGLVWVLVTFFKKKVVSKCPSLKDSVEDASSVIESIVFLVIPIFFLPKLSGCPSANFFGAVCIVSLHYILIFKPQTFAFLGVISALLTGYLSISPYYVQGVTMPDVCRLSATLVMNEDGTKFHKGCWISSSEHFVILRKSIAGNFSTIVIPREEIKLISFGSGGGAQ